MLSPDIGRYLLTAGGVSQGQRRELSPDVGSYLPTSGAISRRWEVSPDGGSSLPTSGDPIYNFSRLSFWSFPFSILSLHRKYLYRYLSIFEREKLSQMNLKIYSMRVEVMFCAHLVQAPWEAQNDWYQFFHYSIEFPMLPFHKVTHHFEFSSVQAFRTFSSAFWVLRSRWALDGLRGVYAWMGHHLKLE